MTHLYIELNGITEEINSLIIEKLYNLASSGDLDETSDLKGRLHSNVGYRYQIEYLNNTYGPDLHIDVSNYAIPFEDLNMLLYLLSLGIGTNGAITEAQAAAADTVANSQNTTVTKFNELRYFTNVTDSRTGFSGNRSGRISFSGWTALEEVDISNFTSIGHDNGAAWEDTFLGCTSLKKVIASDKLTKIGYYAFSGCSNLDTFTGLDGIIEVWNYSFLNCSKLPQSFFQPLSFVLKLYGNNPANIFYGCTLLTSINIALGTTYIPSACFLNCSNLTTVNAPSGITEIKNSAFRGCTSLSSTNIDFSLITSIGEYAFSSCSQFVINSLNVPNLTSLGNNAFNKVLVVTITNLGSITTLQTQTFREITTLTSATLPNTITEIKNHCFYGCSNLATINLPTSCTTLLNNCFDNCTNLDVTLDLSNVTFIGTLAFSNCNKLNISNFPKAATYSNNAFYKMYALTSVTIPKEVVTIGGNCFTECNNIQTLTFELNSQIETISALAFRKCTSLKTLIIPEGCTTIGQEAFGEMGLTLLDIPSTVTNIGSIAFRLAALNATIIFRCNVPTFDSTSDIFAFTPTQLNNVTVKIYVPDDLVTAYQAVPCLSNYTNSIFGISQLPQS